MEILSFLIPVSLFLGFLGLIGFFWAIRGHQFEDLEGDGHRILRKDYDDHPKTDRTGG